MDTLVDVKVEIQMYPGDVYVSISDIYGYQKASWRAALEMHAWLAGFGFQDLAFTPWIPTEVWCRPLFPCREAQWRKSESG